MFFHKITFRGSNDIEIYFDTNLVPYCFPKSMQKLENVDPKRLPIMHPFSLRFWTPKASLLGLNLGPSWRPVSLQDAPRGLPEPHLRACFFYLRAFLFLLTRLPFLLTRLLFHLRTYNRFLADFWSIFGRFFIDFWSICWSLLVGPQSKYLNFPGYFFDVLLAMVKYRGRFKYIIFMGATGQVLKLSWILSNVLFAMVTYLGKFKYIC